MDSHYKNYQENNGYSWGCALKGAKATYSPSMCGKGKKIAPTLISSNPAPITNSIFNHPLPNEKSKKPKKGSDDWYKKKEESSANYLQDLISRIEKGEREFGKAKNKKAFKVDDFTKIGKKKKTKNSEDSEVKINKPKKNKKSVDAILKQEKHKWKDLFKQNQASSACRPNQIRAQAYCRNKHTGS